MFINFNIFLANKIALLVHLLLQTISDVMRQVNKMCFDKCFSTEQLLGALS